MITSIYDVQSCPECSSNNLSYIIERDQVVCRECGLVYEPLSEKEETRYERVSVSSKGTASKANAAIQKKTETKKVAAKKAAKKTAKKSVPKKKAQKKKR